jgi:hypothetical protein
MEQGKRRGEIKCGIWEQIKMEAELPTSKRREKGKNSLPRRL